jgi:hypothetical protein
VGLKLKVDGKTGVVEVVSRAPPPLLPLLLLPPLLPHVGRVFKNTQPAPPPTPFAFRRNAPGRLPALQSAGTLNRKDRWNGADNERRIAQVLRRSRAFRRSVSNERRNAPETGGAGSGDGSVSARSGALDARVYRRD